MAISARLTMELCLVQAEKSLSQSGLVSDLFRNFPITSSEANLNQISALVNEDGLNKGALTKIADYLSGVRPG